MRKPAIGFVLACVFLDALGIGLIVPVLPRLIGSLADTRDLQTSWYGAIMVSYGLMQFFFAPILGALSDRIGRRPVLLTGILGLSIMMIVPAVSQSLPFILLSDPERQAIEAYGVWQEKKNYGKVSMGVVRSTYIIDEDGLVEKVMPKVKPDTNAAEIIEYLREGK